MASLLTRLALARPSLQRITPSNSLLSKTIRAYSNHPRLPPNRSIQHTLQNLQSSRIPSTTRNFSASAPLCVKRVKKYKLKTNHAAAARWKALANRLYKRRREGKSHFNVKKSPAQMNRLGKDAYAVPYHVRHLKRLLPYA